jgi:IS30 family transposase
MADTYATLLIERHAGRVATITADNGTEFHSYRRIEQSTGVEPAQRAKLES